MKTLSAVWRAAVAKEAMMSQCHKTLFVPPPQDAGNLTDDSIEDTACLGDLLLGFLFWAFIWVTFIIAT